MTDFLAVEKVALVLPSFTPGQDVRSDLEELQAAARRGVEAVTSRLATQEQQEEAARVAWEAAKHREREAVAELELQAKSLMEMQAELESVKGEQLCMESSSLMERLESQQVREGKLRAEEAHVIFNTLNTGTWGSEEEKEQKLTHLKDYLHSIGAEKTLVAASGGFTTEPERRGEFDKISIEHISEELSEKRKALQDSLEALAPSERRLNAQGLGLQALVEISEQAVQLALEKCDEIQRELKGYTVAMKEKKLVSLKETKELQALKEELADAQAKASQHDDAVTALNSLMKDAELGEAVQQPSEPPQKRPRMDEAVASPARLRR